MKILLNKYIILCLILVASTTSCDDVLNIDPVGQQTLEVTFSDFAGAVAAVNGIYSRLTTSNLYKNTNALLMIDQASDDVLYGPRQTPNYSLIDYFEVVPTNTAMTDIWNASYEMVYRANVVVDRMPGVEIPAVSANNSAGLPFKDQFVGEAKFLRAFAYFNLVRIFGEIPMHVKEISDVDNINVPRSSLVQIYEQIESDLNDAIQKLPPSYSGSGTGNEKGRVTRWSAYALLADVYLTERKFADARDAAAKVITDGAAFGVRLNDVYTQSFVGRGGAENGPESLFEIQFGGATTATNLVETGNNFARIMSGGDNPSGVGGSTYKPTDNNYLENEPGFTGGLVQAYDANDVRFSTTFFLARGDGSNMRYHVNKHFVLGNNTGNENYVVYRLAEMYLTYAEAVNELSGPTPTAIDYVNRIVRRGHGLSMTSPSVYDVPSTINQSDFRNFLRDERRRELALENKRWFDLLRYGYDYMYDVLVNKQKRVNFKQEFMLFPIPANELIANPLIAPQNPGYNN